MGAGGRAPRCIGGRLKQAGGWGARALHSELRRLFTDLSTSGKTVRLHTHACAALDSDTAVF